MDNKLKANFIMSNKEYKEGNVSVFSQKFQGIEIKKAILTITALGLYEANINGKKVGNQFFSPGFTYYHRHLLYQAYDVSDMISSDNNELTIYLGQGWYCGRFTYNNKIQIYGDKSAVSWILSIELKNGNTLMFVSNENVDEIESPYDYAGFYDGEIYFAGRDKKIIGKAIRYDGNIPEIIEETQTKVKAHEEIAPLKVIKKKDVVIVDFGQNFAGFLEINPSKMNGDYIKIRHGEILDGVGDLYTTNLRKAKAEIIYHKSKENKKYRPKFTYMGFRYIEISGSEYADGLLTAYAIYTEMDRTGHFHCDNNMVQKLYDNQVWGQKSNYVEVPTDCPQRDERMGYTGDGHVFALTGSYNFNTEIFWAKFLKDIRYSQMDNKEGYIGSTVPADGPTGIGYLSMLGWGNAVTILPNMLYWQYGEDKYFSEQYESMKLFVDSEIRKMGRDNLWISPSLGDWLMPGKGVPWLAMHNGPVSNAFIVNDLKILSETADKLGKLEDAKIYREQLGKTKNAYIKRFIKSNGKMKEDYQGAYIMAIKFVLDDSELKNKVFSHLVRNIKEKGMQTGFFSTEHILPMLADEGCEDMAFDLLIQEECPGWMYQIKQGATTTWERWDALRPDGTVNEEKMSDDNMVSFNHYAFGSVGEFYYQYILGIKPLEPGYKKIGIRPFIDKRIGNVSGSYDSASGLIKVSWELIGKTARIDVETPSETEIQLPDGEKHTVESGTYSYECKY